ncbi:MAG: caspase family protein [Blastocatellia bacterium]
MKALQALSLCLIVLGGLAVSPAARPQQDSARDVRIRVGATQQEVTAGKLPQLWAVIIGISRYGNGDEFINGSQIRNLKYAADDAQAIYDFLRSDEGGGFRDVSEGGHLLLLKDEQATRAGVERALQSLKQSRPEDYFVLYIATHGILVPQPDPQLKTTREIPYFVLYDTLPDEKEVERTALRMEAFKKAVNEIPARKGLVLTDTCHSAGVLMSGRDLGITTRANAKLLEEIRRIPQGIGWITASEQTEKSYEPDDLKHGVFTWTLLEALRGQADTNHDQMVSFTELVSYLRDEVPKRTENRQHPHWNTDTVEANYLPLSKVRYTGPVTNSAATETAWGTLVIRNPDVDGVGLLVDGTDQGTLNSRSERSVKLQTGPHTLEFVKDKFRVQRRATIEGGKSQLFEINLTFSQADEDDLVEPSKEQVSVNLLEDKPPGKEAQELFLKGVDSFKRLKYQEAIDLLTRAVQANNGPWAEALVYRGRAEQSLGRYRAAVNTLNTALQLRPTDFQTQTLLAEARLQAGDNRQEVVATLQKVIALHQNYDYARVVYGDLLFGEGDLIRAEIQLRRAILSRPKSPPAHLILADVLMQRGAKEMIEARTEQRDTKEASARLREAITEAETALRLFEELGRKQVSVAGSLRSLSISHIIFGGARYNNAVVLAEARHTLAKALTTLVERDETLADPALYLDRARTQLQEAMRLAANNPARLALVLETSANCYFLKGDIAHAIEDGERALKMAESLPELQGLPDVRLTLCQAYNNNQKFDKAAEQMRRYLQLVGTRLSPAARQPLEEELRRLQQEAASNRQKRNQDEE